MKQSYTCKIVSEEAIHHHASTSSTPLSDFPSPSLDSQHFLSFLFVLYVIFDERRGHFLPKRCIHLAPQASLAVQLKVIKGNLTQR